MLSAASEGFGHFDEVTGLGYAGDHFGSDGFCAVFGVAEFAIEGRQLGAEIHDGQIHMVRAHLAGELFGGSHETATHAGFLKRGVNGEQAEVAAVSTELDVDDAGEGAVFFAEEEAAFPEIRKGFVGYEAVAHDEEGLDFEGLVDEGHEGREVGFFGESDFHIAEFRV